MADTFRVALSSDFKKADGSPTYPDFDLTTLTLAPDIEIAYLDPEDPIRGEQLEDFDALILLGPRFGPESVPQSGRLGVVARFGVGYDTVDTDACTQAGIALVITPDGVRRPVAVSILTLMLALTGKLMIKDRLARQAADGYAKRADHMGVGLVGRTFGSLGIGNIGSEVFRLLKPLDMSLIAHDPYASTEAAEALGLELVGLEALFRRADVLSISVPLSRDTHHIVNAERLMLMKPSAYLINTARGPLVDQKALTEALSNRRIAGAGLDVLEKEPPDADDPILTLDNVILSPHALCWTDQCFAGNGAADVQAVLAFQKGRVPQGIVNKEVLDKPEWQERLSAMARRHNGR